MISTLHPHYIEWREGYDAFLDCELYSGDRPLNPYEYETEEHEWWEKGFQQAMDDS